MSQIPVKVVATALLQHNHTLLMLRRKKNFGELDTGRGLWEPPGGTVEPGEPIEDALRREVQEETGIELSDALQLVGVVNYVMESHGKSVNRFHVLFAARLTDAMDPELGEEHDEARYVTSSDLGELDMNDALREGVRDCLTSSRAS